MFELIKDVLKLALIVSFLYFAFAAYAGWKHPTWAAFVQKRRIQVLLMLVLAVVAFKVSEDVVNLESGPFDDAMLRFIHAQVPASLDVFFKVITLTGSVKTILPVLVIVAAALLMAGRRFEAMLLTGSLAVAVSVVYVLKTVIGRARPDLWDTDWYWGSSFPSGHTLTTAAVATAASICVGRIWPGKRKLATLIAIGWTVAVGASRLVLGVHWPTDVLAAVCIGVFLPLSLAMLMAHTSGSA